MALDTASKRYSAQHIGSPWRGVNYFPTGTIDAAERLALLYLYSGIEAADTVQVPDVVGQTLESAHTELTDDAFVVAFATAFSSSVAEGLVISQDPAAGEAASNGATVTITVSVGTAQSAVNGPDIIRSLLMRDDLALFDGSSTYKRPDITGGTVTALRVDDEIDVLQVFGAGTKRTSATIALLAKHITTHVTARFSPGVWTITESVTVPANIASTIKAGCVFNVVSGATLTFNGPITVEYETWHDGDVVANGGAFGFPNW